jgi:MFS transporter, ACS family, hexuronate transporter
LLLARAISDPFWFFFQYWQIAFLREQIHMSLANVGRWAWIPPLVATLVAFGFASFSDRLIGRGFSVVRARILPILLATTLGVSVFLLPLANTVATAIALSALAVAMGNTWLSLSAILMGALVPRAALASALGLMSAIGGTSAIILNSFAGRLIDRFGYAAPLWLGALLYPIAAVLLATQLSQKPDDPASARSSP